MSMGPTFIGCDAGSTDPGPYYLGAGKSLASPRALRRDLELLLTAAVSAGIPLIIGSAGTGGGRTHLEQTLAIVRSIASERSLHFRLAAIDAEVPAAVVRRALEEGRLAPLQNAPTFGHAEIDGAIRIVAQMGAEPFIDALQEGAQVIIAGRASDSAIFAAIPLMNGADPGPAWHAAKILECGAAAVAQRLYPDCMMADIRQHDFSVYAPNAALRCTPQSVAAHTLYENADPYLITEPSGIIDTTACSYEEESGGAVRVSGSRFLEKANYDVKLEAVAERGHRHLIPGAIRDPLILRNLDRFLQESRQVVETKVSESLGHEVGRDFDLLFRVYGRDGAMGDLEPLAGRVGHEVGLHLEVLSGERSVGHEVCAVAWHTILHHPIPEWSGLVSNIAFPYSPPEVYVGPVFEFVANHVMQIDDPLSPFSISYEML
jgi:hypothetical protein